MEYAAGVALCMSNWEVFVGINVLLVINYTISFIEENNSRNEVADRMAGLSPKTKV